MGEMITLNNKCRFYNRVIGYVAIYFFLFYQSSPTIIMSEHSYMYFNIQEQIIIFMMLEGHSREGTNASPFHDFANNFSEKNITIRITYIQLCIHQL